MKDRNESYKTALYRLFDDQDHLLYVGITKNIKRRWYQHSACQVWWPQVAHKHIQWFQNRSTALTAEANAINTENPRYNARKDPITGEVRVPPREVDIWAAERRVASALRKEIADGLYPADTDLRRAEIAERHNVPILAVSFALHDLYCAQVLYCPTPNRYRVPRA